MIPMDAGFENESKKFPELGDYFFMFAILLFILIIFSAAVKYLVWG